ncbi:helicase-exonuclease AddAB subunit AddB [Alkalihalobacillus sp. AL-G]|uniref:helicase-exonuclease AddAB subunit AddB n=1 Tax=Alkalihalobacillus sp. AL-G TaxID=2926399 RepID=UPI00272B1DC2|nr:helicase-exonuclease AddAB subunit AddB [Alkalihalobacillus sp. AL-G]WLD94837.1 helicase-exonuclease AddAB subunit AddB [Alkalihalobacillus sp. AL-G]
MSIRFKIGRAGSGKTTSCLEELRERLKKEPHGKPLIFLVPDQMTFQMEYELIKTPGLGGMIRSQVFSFSRLALKVLQEVGGLTRYHLNSTGMNMLLRKVVEKNKDDLRLFQKSTDQPGFYEQLEEMITEFKRYCLSSDDLESFAMNFFNGKEDRKLLADKLHDVHIIYQRLEELVADKYIDSEDYLRLFEERIPDSTYLNDCEIWVDGFHSYTPQELGVLAALMRKAKQMTITVTLDHPRENTPSDLDLFRMTTATQQKLQEMAQEAGVQVDSCDVLNQFPKFGDTPSIRHVENYYHERPVVPFYGESSVTLSGAVNRRAEIEGVARDIQDLVQNKGYRYKEIAILVRDASSYSDLLDTIFVDYEIPYFLDQKRSMLHHPLIECIRSSIDVILQNWRYDAVFRCVKTDLLFPFDENRSTRQFREQVDQLENFVLAHGIHGKKHWTSKKDWVYRKYRSLDQSFGSQTDEERNKQLMINDARQMIADPLARLERDLKSAKNGKQLCEALFLYLEDLRAPAKLEEWRYQAEKEGALSLAREHDQVWGAVIDLLEQMVEIAGNEPIGLELFSKMLDTGLESMRFALVPPSIDQVLIGSLDRSRLYNVKCSFVIGVNDGILPAKPKEEGIFSEDDREKLLEQGVELAPTARQSLLDEPFLIYNAMSSASDYLFVSYPLADEEGKSLVPSILMNQLKELFPEQKERLLMQEPGDGEESDDRFIVRPARTLSYLTVQLRQWQKGYPVSSIWWDVYNWFVENERWSDTAKRTVHSLFYVNKAEQLTKKTSQELYGDHLKASVSRMEKHQSCPFSHFASYGLKLEERPLFRLEAPDIGQLFHAALKEVADYLKQRNIDWQELSAKDCYRIAGEMVERLAPMLQSQILLSSNRYNYIKRKLKNVVGRAAYVLSEQAKASGFSPVGLELGFGMGDQLPPLKYTLPNGSTMEVIGRIDRVDAAESSDGLVLRVIDYKSSQRGLNLAEVYYGIALQMLTYLDVVLTYSDTWMGKTAKPAGVLYFHVHDPVHSSKKLLTPEEIEKELFKKFKMKGLVLEDEEVVQLMDDTIDGHSSIIPVATKKGGGFQKRSSVISHEQFDEVRSYVRSMIGSIGTEITDGKIDISPYEIRKRTPCTFCSYRSVCQFDQSLDENNYRTLINIKDEEAFEGMRKKEGQDDA